MKNWFLIVWCLFSLMLTAQNVKVSQEINLKNEYAYDLFKLNNNIVFYRDRGDEYFVDIFDLDLNFKRTAEIFINEKKISIDCIHEVDSNMIVYYSHTKKDTSYIHAVRYDKYFNKTDTANIYKGPNKFKKGELKYVLSLDKSKIVFFYEKGKQMHVFSFDTRNFTSIENLTIDTKDIDLDRDFVGAEVSNEGHTFFLFDKNNGSWLKENHVYQLINIVGINVSLVNVLMNNQVSTGVKMKYDNLNKSLVLAGLYSDNSDTESIGYFSVIMDQSDYTVNGMRFPKFNLFDTKLAKDIENAEMKNGKLIINDFFPKALLLRNDGGMVLVTELQRQYSRRFNSNNLGIDRSQGLRSYIDYFSDDLLLFSINNDGSNLWSTTLFKKQFSQDDDGIFSSILIMRNPSTMHIIFNDEIKNNNTVSEYIVDGLGNHKRRSVLSTEYQNLKIKFKDGFQISPREFIAISERASKINIIKVGI